MKKATQLIVPALTGSLLLIAIGAYVSAAGRDETLLPYQQCMDKCKIHYERGVNEGMRQAAEYCLVYGGFITEDADGMRINVKCSVIIE